MRFSLVKISRHYLSRPFSNNVAQDKRVRIHNTPCSPASVLAIHSSNTCRACFLGPRCALWRGRYDGRSRARPEPVCGSERADIEITTGMGSPRATGLHTRRRRRLTCATAISSVARPIHALRALQMDRQRCLSFRLLSEDILQAGMVHRYAATPDLTLPR
jgi:hypothetical protein